MALYRPAGVLGCPGPCGSPVDRSHAITVSPYLGFGSMQPLLDLAAANGRGVFVLAATSNPEGASVQRAITDGRTVAQSIIDDAGAVNRAGFPEPGSVGVVVGAATQVGPVMVLPSTSELVAPSSMPYPPRPAR